MCLRLTILFSIFIAGTLGCHSSNQPPLSMVPMTTSSEEANISTTPPSPIVKEVGFDLLTFPVKQAATGSFVVQADGTLQFLYTSTFKHQAGTSVNWVVPQDGKESVLVVHEIIAPMPASWPPDCVTQNEGLSAMWMNDVVPFKGIMIGGFELNSSHAAGTYRLNISVDGTPLSSLTFTVGVEESPPNTISMSKAASIIEACQDESMQSGLAEKCRSMFQNAVIGH